MVHFRLFPLTDLYVFNAIQCFRRPNSVQGFLLSNPTYLFIMIFTTTEDSMRSSREINGTATKIYVMQFIIQV